MKKAVAALISVIIIISAAVCAQANGGDIPEWAINSTADYLLQNAAEPKVGSIGGEWTVIGLARSGISVPNGYFDRYYAEVKRYVTECGGVLSTRKYTEYSRMILALTAIGRNPENVGGYNLVAPLADYSKTVMQGINGAIWALIALDSAGYNIPPLPDDAAKSGATQATRQMYLDKILGSQNDDGGWSMSGSASDPDITAMALQALSKYMSDASVADAVQSGIACMSEMQTESGGFSSWGTENSESCAQAIVALCELKIPLDNERFVKGGRTLADNLMSYFVTGGGFMHSKEVNSANLMASEQCFYAIVAAKRSAEKKTSLYDMSDVTDSTAKVKFPLMQYTFFPLKKYTAVHGGVVN